MQSQIQDCPKAGGGGGGPFVWKMGQTVQDRPLICALIPIQYLCATRMLNLLKDINSNIITITSI